MIRRPPRSNRSSTLFPYTTLCRSPQRSHFSHSPSGTLRFLGAPGSVRMRAGITFFSQDMRSVYLGAAGPRRPESLAHGAIQRSEEHTSELQSLMRISYAVFCLKKKKNHKL